MIRFSNLAQAVALSCLLLSSKTALAEEVREGEETEERRAYDQQASFDFAFGGLGVVHSSGGTPSVDVGASIGFVSVLVLRAALGYAPVLSDEEVIDHSGRLRGELLLRWPGTEWAPFIGVGGGAWLMEEPKHPKIAGEIHGVIGIDYTVSELLVFGIDMRAGGVHRRGDWLIPVEGQVRISRLFNLF